MLGRRLPHVKGAIDETGVFVLCGKLLNGLDHYMMLTICTRNFSMRNLGSMERDAIGGIYNLLMNGEQKMKTNLDGPSQFHLPKLL